MASEEHVHSPEGFQVGARWPAGASTSISTSSGPLVWVICIVAVGRATAGVVSPGVAEGEPGLNACCIERLAPRPLRIRPRRDIRRCVELVAVGLAEADAALSAGAHTLVKSPTG